MHRPSNAAGLVPRGARPAVDGVLVVDKPHGLTSHDVVASARRLLGTRRVGHLGTLDPLATGVLPLVVGRATRLATLLAGGPKTYAAVIRLGVVTDTYDVTGTVMPAGGHDPALAAALDRRRLEAACRAFTGTFRQQPPPFSAKKVRGVRAYRLARREEPVELRAAEVTVHSFEILKLGDVELECRICCEPGFYMRSLAHDLGRALGCGACLRSLRREVSGAFTLDQAVTLEALAGEGVEPARQIVALADLLADLPAVVVTARGAERAAHGNLLRAIDLVETGAEPRRLHPAAQRFRVHDAAGTLLAVAEVAAGGALHPRIVLV